MGGTLPALGPSRSGGADQPCAPVSPIPIVDSEKV